jgi:FkbM family methyltransferase
MVSASGSMNRQLDELLSEGIDAARERERTSFDKASAPFGTRLVLFGAGNLGRKVLAALRAEGIEPLAFVDNNEQLWGTKIDGLTVLPRPEGAKCFGQSATFCVTTWRGEGTDTMADCCRSLQSLGCTNVIDFGPLFWKFSRRLLPHYSLDLPHKVLLAKDKVRAGFDLWHDDVSRAEYLAQVRWRLRLDFDNLPLPVSEKIYFPASLINLSPDEVFVDCGAFDGDTIRDFLKNSDGRFRRIYAFEADKRNFTKLARYVGDLPAPLRERIQVVEKAIAENAGILRFSATGTDAAAVSAQGIEVASVALDTQLAEAPTFIKMDIEGSEPEALRGASGLISRHAPILCVCVYHAQDHLWRVPQQIADHGVGYEMHLRPHLRASWDLVCYAIPAARRQA